MTEEFAIQAIQSDFDKIIQYNYQYVAQYMTFNSTPLLTEWFQKKKRLISLFHDQLIYEVGEVSYTLEPETKALKLGAFINKIKHNYCLYSLAYFLKAFSNEFFTTQVTSEEFNYEDICIPKGTKIIKSFKYFLPPERTDLLHTLQNQASQIIQENKVTGVLCLSVHPLDYLSVSENTYNWRSCHALDGDYCAGNLSYMCDETTIVCYIRGKDEKPLPHFGEVEWNSKKWRMLLFTSEERNLVYAGRHYPFFCKQAMDEILETFRLDLRWTPIEFSSWHDDLINQFKYKEKDRLWTSVEARNPMAVINQYFVDPNTIIRDESELHFNDLLHSTVYTPYYAWSFNWTPNEILIVGSIPLCPCCGTRHLWQSSSLICNNCIDFAANCHKQGEFIGYCTNCDKSIFEHDDYGISQDEEGEVRFFCSSCFESLTVECHRCGTYVMTDFINPIPNLETQEYEYYCSNCARIVTMERRENNGERTNCEERCC